MKQLFKKRGFTLIEILVVATIISMLAAGGFVSYSTFTKQSRDARRQADLEQIRAALEQYRSNESTYPGSLTSGDSLFVGTNVYMSKVPSDPESKYSYSFVFPNPPTTYTLCAYLEGRGSSSAPPIGGAGAGVPGVSTCGAGNCNYCLGPYGEVTPP